MAKWTSASNHKFEISFLNPHINDGPWSIGFNTAYEALESQYASGINIPEKRFQGSATLGRSIFEMVRTHVTFKHLNIKQEKRTYRSKNISKKRRPSRHTSLFTRGNHIRVNSVISRLHKRAI